MSAAEENTRGKRKAAKIGTTNKNTITISNVGNSSSNSSSNSKSNSDSSSKATPSTSKPADSKPASKPSASKPAPTPKKDEAPSMKSKLQRKIKQVKTKREAAKATGNKKRVMRLRPRLKKLTEKRKESARMKTTVKPMAMQQTRSVSMRGTMRNNRGSQRMTNRPAVPKIMKAVAKRMKRRSVRIMRGRR